MSHAWVVGSSPGSASHASFLLAPALAGGSDGGSIGVCTTHMGAMNQVPKSSLWPSPISAIVDISETNQQREDTLYGSKSENRYPCQFVQNADT